MIAMKFAGKQNLDNVGQFVTGAPRPTAMPSAEHQIDLHHEDDETLVARTQKGGSTAFDVLIGRYRERLYATVYHMTANHEDANDLVQETFIKAFKSIDS